MSPENVEVRRRALDAFNRRDFDHSDEMFTPDFQWFPAFPVVESEGYQGRDSIERYLEEIANTWDRFSLVPDEYCDLGNSVLVFGRFTARGRTSGVAVDSPLAAVFEFHDGRCSQCRAFFSREEALKAVGLQE